MNTKYNNIDAMIQDYVLERLNDAQASDFEEYFLSNPEIAEQVEIAQDLRAGLLEMEKTKLLSTVSSDKTEITNKRSREQKSGKSIYEKLVGLVSIPVPAFAVMAMAAIMLPLALQGLSGNTFNPNISLINFSTQTTRSADQAITIDLSESDKNPAMLIKFRAVEFPNYKLKLIPIGENNPVWESELFKLSPLRDKLVSLPNGSLGEVTVNIVGIDDNLNETAVEFCHYSEVCQ